jgi:hypothetical protein
LKKPKGMGGIDAPHISFIADGVQTFLPDPYSIISSIFSR